MSNNTQISQIMQGLIKKEIVENICEKYNYKDTGRKLTVYVLFQYFILAALIESKSFRELSLQGEYYGLPKVDYSTLSKKASEINYKIFAEIFIYIFNKCNRNHKRKIRSKCGRILKIIDSTRIIKHESNWKWAKYLGEKSGIKFHVAYLPESGVPCQIESSTINTGDSTVMEKFAENDTLLICDRGYLNIEKMSNFDCSGQEFIIRMREGINQLNTIDFDIAHDKKYQDYLCNLGKCRSIKSEYRNHQFRVINFYSDDNELVCLCTNIVDLSADEIADVYRQRWTIESFFRELKQNFTIKSIFGKSQNSAFSQGIVAFICYLATFSIYTSWNKLRLSPTNFLSFLRKLRYKSLNCHCKTFLAILKSIFS